MNRWHLQVCEREWVVWWYGPLQAGATAGHIAPAVTYVADCELPFTLPEHRAGSGLLPPQEIRRVTSWGWRFRTNDGIHDSGWHLTNSREKCILEAADYLSRSPKGDQEALAGAADDVREYKTGLW